MSHFSVAVIHREDQSVEELLAPYQENNMGDCPAEYMEFTDITDDLHHRFENETETRFVDAAGQYHFPTEKQFEKIITKEEYDEAIKNNERASFRFTHGGGEREYYKFVYPEGELRDIPVKELYDSFEDWAEDENYVPDEDGRYGYWDNPNAKWDWYEVGGRWAGMLKAKAGAHGSPSFMLKDYEEKEGFYDSAKIKDIDFSPDEEEKKKAIRFWEVVVEDAPLREDESENQFFHLYKKAYYLERYGTKERYANECASVGTFAVITPDGEWHEKGQMGWFGCSSETPEEARQWSDSWYDTFIKDRDGDEYLTVVDCHI